MTNGSRQETYDSSMPDLFRSEVETHTAVVNDGLLALENAPGAIDRFEALMRAVHSIKGGARIMELDAAADLAYGMEECFVAAQRGKLALNAEHIGVLRKGSAMLVEIAEHADENWSEWFNEHQHDINQLLTSFRAFVTTATPDTPPQQPPEPQATQADQAVPKTSPPALQKGSQTGSVDISMLEMFCTEVETHTATLNEGLLALESKPDAVDRYEGLMRAAHSIKGGARIVHLDAAVDLAHVMEDCFVAAQRGDLALTSEHIDLLLEGSDMLGRLAEVAGDEAIDWPVDAQETLEYLIASITAILQGKEIPPLKKNIHPGSVKVGERSPNPSIQNEKRPKRLSTPQSSASSESQRTVKGSQRSRMSASQRATTEKDRMVRVTAEKIERLMGLAGEVVVSARWLPPFAESLLSLKRTHVELFTILEKLREVLGHDGDERTRSLVLQAREKNKESSGMLADRLNQLDMFTSASASLSDRLYHEVIGVRMRPFADGVMGFPRMVRDLARKLGKKVNFEIIGKATEVDRDILEKLDAPITHLLRNALDHGIEMPEERSAAGKPEIGSLRLEAMHRSGMLMITISDDGKGINLQKLRKKILQKGLTNAEIVEQLTEAELLEFLFLPGFSTSENVTEISGRGVGLDVVHDMVHAVRGVVRAASKFGQGTSFQLELPLTLSVIRTFLVSIAGELYAFPLARIDRCVMVAKKDIKLVEDRQYFRFDNANIALVDIHNVLEIEDALPWKHELPVVVVSDRSNAYGLVVDTFVGECDLVVRPLDSRLGKVPDVSAAAVMLDGTPVLIFDVEDLVRSIDKLLGGQQLSKISKTGPDADDVSAKRILVVDDSITVREMERKLLESHGYHVDVAVDGMDGWNAVRTSHFDMVVSDVDMPRMNGIEFISHIKQHEELKSIPVIIISYKDTEEHRLQGLEVGANYYLTKSSFHDNSFIDAVIDLIGEARA